MQCSIEFLEQLHQQLIKSRFKIAVAESISAGHLQSALASQSGSSAYFLGGITAYQLQQKVELLGVDANHAQQVNCVSALVAEQMAIGVRRLFNADIGLSTTGYAEQSLLHKVTHPHAYIGLCWRNIDTNFISHAYVSQQQLQRLEMQQFVCKKALEILLEKLSGIGKLHV